MKWWIVVVLIGGALIASGAGVGAKSSQPGEITCGSDVMRPGDVCEETRRGVTVDTYTYEEKLQEEKDSAATFARSGRWVQLGIGAGVVVLGVVGIVFARRRRAQQATVVQQMVQQQAAWQGQPPQHPGQPGQMRQSGPAPQYPQAPQRAPQPAQPAHMGKYNQPHYPPQPYQPQYPPQDFGPRGH